MNTQMRITVKGVLTSDDNIAVVNLILSALDQLFRNISLSVGKNKIEAMRRDDPSRHDDGEFMIRERTIEAITEDDLVSRYAGLIHADGQHEYYFGNDTEEAEEL